MKIKKTYQIAYLLLLILISGVGLMAQSGSNTRILKPTNYQKRLTHISSEKSRKYYSLNTKNASVLSLHGPGILRILTRGRFVKGAPENISYTITYIVDGGDKTEIEMNSVKRAKNTTYLNSDLGIPGELKDFYIELGRGNHSIEFFIEDENIPVAARYKFTLTKAKKQKWISYSPLPPSDPVNLISRESTVKYYRFSVGQPLRVEVNGPTQLRVLSRIENYYHMKGRIYYRIQVKENDEVINTYQLNSRRSEITTYQDQKDLVPGKACEFVIDIPKGNHTYEIVFLDEGKGTILGRIMLPEKDVRLSH